MSSEINKISAILILEVLGKPKEHLVETLKNMAETIGKEKNVSVTNKNIYEPVELKEKNGVFSSFMELEVTVENPLYLVMLMFKYMPSSVEVIEPEKITFKNNDLGEILSEITRRLHKYDEVARVVLMEKRILENKLKQISEEKPKNLVQEETKKSFSSKSKKENLKTKTTKTKKN